jgi:hypothetical protein
VGYVDEKSVLSIKERDGVDHCAGILAVSADAAWRIGVSTSEVSQILKCYGLICL